MTEKALQMWLGIATDIAGMAFVPTSAAEIITDIW